MREQKNKPRGEERQAVLEYLRKKGSDGATNKELIANINSSYSDRLRELRKAGHQIETERFNQYHSVYRLIEAL
jgi:hypothetical protein